MATPIIDHNLLTLDYWQDSVTYEGKTVPGGTIGCEALNIPDTLREKLAQASIPLQKIVAAIKENNLTAELLRPAKGSVLHMIQLAKDTLPFSRADAAYYNGRVEHIFSEEGIQNTLAYVQAAAVVGLLATFNEQFRQGVGITKIITLAEELPSTIRNYKSGMTAFADELHKGKRTPDGYAQVFGRIFSGVYQCLNLINHTLTVFRISYSKPFAGSIQYLNGSSTVINQLVHHQRNKEFALQVFHVLRIA